MTQGGTGGIGGVVGGAATTAAVALPNTGSASYLTIALAVGAGLVTWGVLYARSR